MYICSRLSTNNSQVGDTKSQALLENNNNKSNIDQLLPDEIVTTTQLFIPTNPTHMIPSQTSLIPNVPQYDNNIRKQESRRRRRQRRRQHRREHQEALRWQQAQQRRQREQRRWQREQQQQQQIRHRQRRQQRYEQ